MRLETLGHSQCLLTVTRNLYKLGYHIPCRCSVPDSLRLHYANLGDLLCLMAPPTGVLCLRATRGDCRVSSWTWFLS